MQTLVYISEYDGFEANSAVLALFWHCFDTVWHCISLGTPFGPQKYLKYKTFSGPRMRSGGRSQGPTARSYPREGWQCQTDRAEGGDMTVPGTRLAPVIPWVGPWQYPTGIPTRYYPTTPGTPTPGTVPSMLYLRWFWDPTSTLSLFC